MADHSSQVTSKVSPLRTFDAPAVDAYRARRRFAGKVDTRRRRKLKDVARTLPRAPGVYFFYGAQGRLLYIGKAKCLRERVGSYFGETSIARPPKLRRLLAEIKRLEFEECGSELEALLVERRLIAEHLPLLNYQYKRFKVYPYLLLTHEPFPRLTLTKTEPFGDGDEEEPPPLATGANLPLETPPHLGELPGLYLGPFNNTSTAVETLEAMRGLFPLRTCEGELRPDPNGRACFYHDIKRCGAPCVGRVTQDAYAQLCAELLHLLRTGVAPQLDALRARMMALAAEMRFEEAARLRDQLQVIDIVAARLRRLERMRHDNNAAIIQPARVTGSDAPRRPCVFLVQNGVVRRHVVVTDWAALKATLRAVYATPPPVAEFTAKEELDEMMILDRWLQAHRDDPCCIWLNDRASRQWAAVAVRRLQAWSQRELGAPPS